MLGNPVYTESEKKMLVTLFNYLRLGRPYYVLPAVATAVAGYWSGTAGAHLSLNTGILSLVFGLLGMSCWSANEIADRHYDARGRTKCKWGLYVSGGTAVLMCGLLSVRAAAVYVVVLAVAGLAIATLLGGACWVLCALFLIIGMAYSLRPVRLKDRGVVGLGAVAVAYGIVAFMAGWVVGGQSLRMGALLFATVLSVAFFGFEGIAHLLDHNQDERNGEQTFAVSLGCDKARHVLALCQCLPAASVVLVSLLSQSVILRVNVFVLLPFLVASALIAASTAGRQDESSLRTIRLLSVPLMSGFAFLIA